ncbi:MAG: hypothetical protein KGL95_11635, partial [Patescibacteria group bacterium]|nr:hypothetical protein [Patescibacteria group bacterium]
GQVFQIQEEDIDNSTLPHEIGHILGLPDRYMTGLKGDTNTPTTEAQYTGTLMGKINPQGTGKPQRQLTQDDIEDIAKSTGMTCDAKKCCPRKSEEKKGYTGTQEKEKKPEEPKTGR